VKMLRIGVIALLFSFSFEAQALTWEDLWLTHNQQGYRALSQGDPTIAAQLFTIPQWQGLAYYRMGDYERALQAFSQNNDAISFYNRGNALAHLGRYQDAIHAYDKALALNIHLDDAQFNRNLLKKMLQSQTPKPQATPPFKQNYERNKSDNQNNSSSINNSNNDSSTTEDKNNSGQEQTQSNTTNTTPSSPNNLQDLSPNTTQQSLPSSTENPPSTDSSTSPENDTQQPADSDRKIETESQSQSTNDSDQQQQQALQNVNDDPGELLQRKFARDYAQQPQGE
jgi:Ca-activated chloride channel family protein